MKSKNLTYTRMPFIPPSIINEAEQRAKNQPVHKKSHREEANGIGCLGEVIFEEWMRKRGIEFKAELDEKTHDYRVN